ncbi:DNA-directed RNA polymerase [Segatella salivae]
MLNIINRTIIQLFQRCKRCTFDSPGLPNDSAGYPGLAYGVHGTTL